MNQQPTDQDAAELMARHGIIRVETVQYRYKTWRYTHLSDAVVQAARDTSFELAPVK